MCRLIAVIGARQCDDHQMGKVDKPRYQFSASEGDGASKYRIALLSTSRRAKGRHLLGP